MAMISFNPKDAAQVHPEGDYEAEILSVQETTAKSSGAPMYVVTWKIFLSNGRHGQLIDRIVSPTMLWKLKKICQACGIEGFESGALELDAFRGRGCTVSLKIKAGAGDFADQNNISAYKKIGGEPSTPAKQSTELSIDESTIPF